MRPDWRQRKSNATDENNCLYDSHQLSMKNKSYWYSPDQALMLITILPSSSSLYQPQLLDTWLNSFLPGLAKPLFLLQAPYNSFAFQRLTSTLSQILPRDLYHSIARITSFQSMNQFNIRLTRRFLSSSAKWRITTLYFQQEINTCHIIDGKGSSTHLYIRFQQGPSSTYILLHLPKRKRHLSELKRDALHENHPRTSSLFIPNLFEERLWRRHWAEASRGVCGATPDSAPNLKSSLHLQSACDNIRRQYQDDNIFDPHSAQSFVDWY